MYVYNIQTELAVYCSQIIYFTMSLWQIMAWRKKENVEKSEIVISQN